MIRNEFKNFRNTSKSGRGKRGVLATASVAALCLAAQTAHAQESEEEGLVEEVVVTGSLISRPDYVANSPVTSITANAIENTGQLTVEGALKQLPQFAGGFGQSNTSSTGTGLNGGQAYATLRGLGSKRTLILLEGRRLQPSNPDGSVDLNIIPEHLLGNVEVITGGASTVYGSDATAGVVNFRLRRDYDGVTVSSQYGVTEYGDGETFRFNVTSGGNFDEGRGRAVMSLDYSNRDRAKRIERPWYSNRTPETGNAASYHGSAVFTGNEPTLAAVNSIFVGKYGLAPFVASNGSTRYSGGAQLGFNTDGTLFSANGVPARNFREPETDDAYLVNSGNTIFGASQQMKFGFTGGDLQSDMERYGAFGRVDYDLTDTMSFYSQFSFTTYEQFAIVNTTLSNNIYLQSVPYNNPFIPEDLRVILASRSKPTADFQFHKAFNAIGNRGQTYAYDVWQFLSGLTGDVGIKDWTWDAYLSTSSSGFENEQTGGISQSALRTLMYAADGGVSRCEGGLNLFGNFPISDSCAAYISRDTLNTTDMDQRIIEGTVQGGLFELPAGEVRFALGAGYRYNSFDYDSDYALNQADGTSDIIGFAVLRDSSGDVESNEIYGELLVPLLKDLPLIEELSLDIGYRYSDYSSIGGAQTYKADFAWTVFEPLRLRGGYNRAIRAPSVGELYAPISTGSTSIGTAGPTVISGDPCDVRSSFRAGPDAAKVRALCLSQGLLPEIYDGYIGTAQVFPLTGGNPDLKEETADTYSLGAVYTSTFEHPLLSDLSMSLDWYQIEVADAIGVLSVVQSVQYCFNVGGNNPTYDPNNYYCSLLKRAGTGALEAPTSQPLLNLGAFNVSGIDVQVDWGFDLDAIGLPDNWGRFDVRSTLSWTNKFEIQNLPGAPVYDYVGTIGVSVESAAGIAHPDLKANTSFVYSLGEGSIGLTWRHISEMDHSSSVTSTSPPAGIDAYNVFDLSGRYSFPNETDLRVGITNLFNEEPPSYTNVAETYDSSTYDVVGRYFFASVTKRF